MFEKTRNFEINTELLKSTFYKNIISSLKKQYTLLEKRLV